MCVRFFKSNKLFIAIITLVIFLGIVIGNFAFASNDDVSVDFTSEVIDSGKSVQLTLDVKANNDNIT